MKYNNSKITGVTGSSNKGLTNFLYSYADNGLTGESHKFMFKHTNKQIEKHKY